MNSVTQLPQPGIPASLDEAVRRTIARLDALWSAQRSNAGPRLDEVRAQIEYLGTAIRQTFLNGPYALPPRSRRPHLPNERLINLFRRTLLEELRPVATSSDGEQVVCMLTAVERVHEALLGSINRTTEPWADLLIEAAHDMRSPISSILFLVEALRSGSARPLTEHQRRQLGLVYCAAFGLNTLADDLIDLARGSGRLVADEPVPISIPDLVTSLSDIVLPIAEEKGLALQLHIPPMGLRVGYPLAVHRVLLNLVTNALKFTYRGTVTLCATLLPDARVEFAVTDTGPGIPDDVMANLFAPFRPYGNQCLTTFSSAGLGLSVCRALVDAMGGELHVKSTIGVGTHFRVLLDLPAAKP